MEIKLINIILVWVLRLIPVAMLVAILLHLLKQALNSAKKLSLEGKNIWGGISLQFVDRILAIFIIGCGIYGSFLYGLISAFGEITGLGSFILILSIFLVIGGVSLWKNAPVKLEIRLLLIFLIIIPLLILINLLMGKLSPFNSF